MSLLTGAKWLARSTPSKLAAMFAYPADMGTAKRLAWRTAGLGGVIGYSAVSSASKAVLSRYPTTYTTTGFGSGFGMYGRQMPYDGGIGATGDLVLSARTHGVY